MEYHSFPAYYNADSKILILGSFPSAKSRETGFYYSHPQNRFWKVLAYLFNEEITSDIASKKTFLKKHKIALYDVCASCNITGSSDTSIKDVIPCDIAPILATSNITTIYVNGKTAHKLYNKLIKNKINQEAIYLPSTSSANASFSLEKLCQAYKIIQK